MKALVIYDSTYGNTEVIARAIGKALGEQTNVVRVADADPSALSNIDLLVVGSPTNGGRPTPGIAQFLKAIPAGALRHGSVAAFDTRFAPGEQRFWLRSLMGVIGYAAPRIAKALQARGGSSASEPEGFIVLGKEGPLRAGEVERATAWAPTLLKNAAMSRA